jgi:hypothetical protein
MASVARTKNNNKWAPHPAFILPWGQRGARTDREVAEEDEWMVFDKDAGRTFFADQEFAVAAGTAGADGRFLDGHRRKAIMRGSGGNGEGMALVNRWFQADRFHRDNTLRRLNKGNQKPVTIK